MNLSDELLNKYIDGELQGDELDEVQSLLSNEENFKRLKALQVVDQSLRKLEYDSAPAGITEKIMKAVFNSTQKIKLKKNYFAITINIIFVALIAAVLIYAVSLANWNFSTTSFDVKLDNSLKSVKDTVPSFLSFFKNKTVMFWGSILSLILLLGVYYTVEAHKTFKKRLDNISIK